MKCFVRLLTILGYPCCIFLRALCKYYNMCDKELGHLAEARMHTVQTGIQSRIITIATRTLNIQNVLYVIRH